MGDRTLTIDWLSYILLICLGLFGIFILLTIDASLVTLQGLNLVLGFLLLLIIAYLDIPLLTWFAPIGYGIGTFLLTITYLFPPIRGARRWIEVFGLQIQPSELVKPLFLLAFAWFMQRYPVRKTSNVWRHIVFFLVPFLLIFNQPDLGSSIIYAAFWFAMMVASGLSFRVIASLGGVFLVFMPLLWSILAPYQQARIVTFVNPGLDPQGAGYNAVQSTIAVGSGQLFGRGLGRGTQSHLQFLPEYHTDFIFATLVEELGFIGGIVLLGVYGLLLWRVLRPLLRQEVPNAFGFIYAIGLFTMMLVQVVINTGMNMGLLPITGITLPFVSQGGSSVLSLAVSFGLLWALQQGKSRSGSIAIR